MNLTDSLCLLICTLISENQTLEKISGSANLDFFSCLHPEKLGLYYEPEKNPGAKPEKKYRSAGLEIFLGFKIDLDFQKSGCRLKGRMPQILSPE